MNRRALDRGHGIRTGLEDVTLLPDGAQALDNADLVEAAARLIRIDQRNALALLATRIAGTIAWLFLCIYGIATILEGTCKHSVDGT